MSSQRGVRQRDDKDPQHNAHASPDARKPRNSSIGFPRSAQLPQLHCTVPLRQKHRHARSARDRARLPALSASPSDASLRPLSVCEGCRAAAPQGKGRWQKSASQRRRILWRLTGCRRFHQHLFFMAAWTTQCPFVACCSEDFLTLQRGDINAISATCVDFVRSLPAYVPSVAAVLQ
jgi:hypothetical protein